MKSEIASLKTSVKILNVQRVKNYCIVRSVEVKNNANAIEIVLDISKKVGIELKEEIIDEAYFLKKVRNDKDDKKTMAVKFKEMDCMKSVYINNVLSKETLQLFNYPVAEYM